MHWYQESICGDRGTGLVGGQCMHVLEVGLLDCDCVECFIINLFLFMYLFIIILGVAGVFVIF